jgi:hypothetical protein
MKKIYLSIFTALAGLSLNAQTLTDANHSPAAGDNYSTYQCDSTAISAGAAGAGALWNFSTIITHSSAVSNYTAAANANASYPIPGVQVASVLSDMSFYKSTTNDLKYFGGNIVVGPVSASLIYTTAAVMAAYPMSLNTTSSSATGGSINVTAPLAQAGTFTGNSSTIADGTGTLALASGTFNTVVRVVTSQTINFTTPLTSGTVTQKNYNYYNVGTKESLFSISNSTVVTSLSPSASTQTIVKRIKPATPLAVIENANLSNEFSVFPNPSSSTVNFVTENVEAKQIVVFDVTGKLVEKQNLTDGKLKLDVSNYTTGLYMYSVIGNANQTLKSGKITVSH